MVRVKKCMPFLGQKFWFSAKKSDFCHTTPILVDDPFLALGMTVNFPPWEPFFDFPFRSYSCFRKKILVDGSKSLPPSHCGILLYSKSPSALIVQCSAVQSSNRWHFVRNRPLLLTQNAVLETVSTNSGRGAPPPLFGQCPDETIVLQDAFPKDQH